MSGSIVGRCQCESLRFALKAPPLFTHACHCLVCLRRVGTAFGLSTFVLRKDFVITQGELSGKPISPRTTVYQCSECSTTIYSASTAFPATFNLRGGTFDDPGFVQPGAHIWIKRKHPWIELPEEIPQFDEDYVPEDTWPRSALERLQQALTDTY